MINFVNKRFEIISFNLKNSIKGTPKIFIYILYIYIRNVYWQSLFCLFSLLSTQQNESMDCKNTEEWKS